MTEIEREAEKILDDVWKCYISVQNGLEKLKPLLSTNSRPPAGFVRDAEGVDLKICSTRTWIDVASKDLPGGKSMIGFDCLTPLGTAAGKERGE